MTSNPNFYYEGMTGAPVGASGELQGSIVAILDACLVNGFNSHAIGTSLTASGTTATAVDTAHGFKDRQLVAISGATPSGYNGTHRISLVDANTYTFTVGSGLGAASGASAATPSLGWTIEFTASNQRAYRAPEGNRFYLSVDDSPASGNFAPAVRGYQAMSAILTGTDAFPDDGQLSGSPPAVRWLRPIQAGNGGSNYGWCVIGDSKRFYLGTPGYNTGKWRAWFGFGDFTSYLSADAFNAFLGGDVSHGNGVSYYYYANFPWYQQNPARVGSTSFYNTETALARGYDGSTNGVAASLWSAFASGQGSVANTNIATASVSGTPNPITAGIDLSVMDIYEHGTSAANYWRRGRLPGCLAYLGKPDFPSNDAVASSGIPVFGDVITFGGGATAADSGLVFCLSDWDAM